MKRASAILLIISTLFLSGCWGMKELDKNAIASSVVYDIDDNGRFYLNVEIKKAKSSIGKKAGGGGFESLYHLNEGITASEMSNNATLRIEKGVFTSFIQVRFFSQRCADGNISKINDYIMRDYRYRKNAFAVVIKGDNPDSIYKADTGTAKNLGDFIEELSKSQTAATAKSVFITTLDYVKATESEGKQPVLGLCEVIPKSDKEKSQESDRGQEGSGSSNESEDLKDTKIIYEGLVAFKNEKIAGYYDGIETRAYNIVLNKLKSAFISFILENKRNAVEVYSCKTDVKIENGEKIKFDVNTKFSLSLILAGIKENTIEVKNQAMIEQAFNKLMEDEIGKAVKKAQVEFKSDIYGFGELYHKKYPKEWKKIKNNWDDYFEKAEITVKVDSSIISTGKIKEQFSVSK